MKLQGFLTIVKAMGLFGAIGFIIKRKLKLNKVVRFPGIHYPMYLRPDTSDSDVFTQIFISNEYGIEIGIVPEVIIDAGANIGMASVFFKNKFPNAKIIAIEPDPENVEMIKLNTGKYNDMYVKQAALWPTSTKTRISDKHNKGKWALIVEEVKAGDDDIADTSLTQTITIDEIMEEFDLEYIDLLKLDIESAEKELFADGYMHWLPKTKILMIELHDWLKDGSAKSVFSALNTAMQNYSYGQVGENVVIVNRDLVSIADLPKI